MTVVKDLTLSVGCAGVYIESSYSGGKGRRVTGGSQTGLHNNTQSAEEKAKEDTLSLGTRSPSTLSRSFSLPIPQTGGGCYRYPQSPDQYQGRKTLQTHYVTETITGSSHSSYGNTLSLLPPLHLGASCPGCICPLFSLRPFLHSHLSL